MTISIAEMLAGGGATVEVMEPESVRAEPARPGSELVARGTGTGDGQDPAAAGAVGGPAADSR
jgi:hypothetical protein